MKRNNHKLCQLIVKKYIKTNINWPREIKIAQKLIKKFNSYAFWDNLQDLKSSPPSLAWFLKPEGKMFLIKQYEAFNLNFEMAKVKIQKYKIENDKNICKKPKSLLEFIRYGKKT